MLVFTSNSSIRDFRSAQFTPTYRKTHMLSFALSYVSYKFDVRLGVTGIVQEYGSGARHLAANRN